MSPFATLLLRDVKLAARSGGSAALALSFFALVATLMPLGIGADLRLLARVAAGVLWVGAVLAALLSLDRLFQGDYEDGSLDLIALSPLPLELTALAMFALNLAMTLRNRRRTYRAPQPLTPNVRVREAVNAHPELQYRLHEIGITMFDEAGFIAPSMTFGALALAVGRRPWDLLAELGGAPPAAATDPGAASSEVRVFVR